LKKIHSFPPSGNSVYWFPDLNRSSGSGLFYLVLLACLPIPIISGQWLVEAFVPFTAAGQRENHRMAHSSSLTSRQFTTLHPNPKFSASFLCRIKVYIIFQEKLSMMLFQD